LVSAVSTKPLNWWSVSAARLTSVVFWKFLQHTSLHIPFFFLCCVQTCSTYSLPFCHKPTKNTFSSIHPLKTFLAFVWFDAVDELLELEALAWAIMLAWAASTARATTLSTLTLLWCSFEFEKAEKVEILLSLEGLSFLFWQHIKLWSSSTMHVPRVTGEKSKHENKLFFLINRWSFQRALPRRSSVNPRGFCFYHGEKLLQQTHTLKTQCWQCCIQMDTAGNQPCVFRKFYASETRDAWVDGSLNPPCVYIYRSGYVNMKKVLYCLNIELQLSSGPVTQL